MVEGGARLAVFAARGISRRHHRHDYFDDLVDHLERAFGRAGESQPDNESCEGSVVFPRLTGNVGLLRSMDRWGGDAHTDHLWPDGDPVHRYEPAGRGLLHL